MSVFGDSDDGRDGFEDTEEGDGSVSGVEVEACLASLYWTAVVVLQTNESSQVIPAPPNQLFLLVFLLLLQVQRDLGAPLERLPLERSGIPVPPPRAAPPRPSPIPRGCNSSSGFPLGTGLLCTGLDVCQGARPCPRAPRPFIGGDDAGTDLVRWWPLDPGRFDPGELYLVEWAEEKYSYELWFTRRLFNYNEVYKRLIWKNNMSNIPGLAGPWAPLL